MNIRFAYLTGLIVLLGASLALTIMTLSLSVDPEISITLPSPDLAPSLAALSGVWESAQGGVVPSRLVVERIDERRATVLLIGRNHPPGYLNGRWERVRARVLFDGAVQWGYPVRFTLRIGEDDTRLEGQIERAGAASQMTFKKVGTFASPSESTSQATLTKAVERLGD